MSKNLTVKQYVLNCQVKAEVRFPGYASIKEWLNTLGIKLVYGDKAQYYKLVDFVNQELKDNKKMLDKFLGYMQMLERGQEINFAVSDPLSDEMIGLTRAYGVLNLIELIHRVFGRVEIIDEPSNGTTDIKSTAERGVEDSN